MLRLRPYKPDDAAYLLQWTSDWEEESFEKWSAGRLSYPLTAEQLDEYYKQRGRENPDCWQMTATDADGRVVGHLMMRVLDYEKNLLYFGLIMVDSRIRGKGIGKEMIETALDYAFLVCGMEKVVLRVFANNPAAKKCYEAAGFQVESFLPEDYEYKGRKWDAYQMAAFRNE